MGKESKYKLDGNDDEDDDGDDATTTAKIRRRTLSQTLSVTQRLLRQNRRHGVVGRC